MRGDGVGTGITVQKSAEWGGMGNKMVGWGEGMGMTSIPVQVSTVNEALQ